MEGNEIYNESSIHQLQDTPDGAVHGGDWHRNDQSAQADDQGFWK